jgi:Cys-tRNA synthase (O-phospho-L-seryl-tRNA:Cys-tRNA synthase)
VSLITGIFLLFSDIFQSQLGSDTFRGMRFAIGVLLTTGTVAAYHLMVYRGERQFVRMPRTTHNIILVGPKDPELVHEIVEKTGDRVQVLVTTHMDHQVWSHADVLAMLDDARDEDLVIVMNGHGLEAIPVVHALSQL